MRNLGVCTALGLSWIIASCAESMVNPAGIPEPVPALEAAPKARPNNVEVRRQAKKIAEDAEMRSAILSRQVSPNVSPKEELPPQPEAQPPQAPQQPPEPRISPEPPTVVVLPPPPQPTEPNFPVAALMPEPPEPAEPTFSSTPPTVELPLPLEPAVPKVPIEAAMPPPPEAAEPSFPVAALPPLEPAEPSLPQVEIAAESLTSLSYPDLPSYLSMRPRLVWEDVTGSFEVPRRPLSEAPELNPERQIPSLIRNPWPLLIDGS